MTNNLSEKKNKDILEYSKEYKYAKKSVINLLKTLNLDNIYKLKLYIDNFNSSTVIYK